MLSHSFIDGGRRALALGLLISAAVLAPASARSLDNPEVILDLDSSVAVYALVQGRDGQLYGAGYVGGWAVFRVVPGSRLEALHVFTEAEGAFPRGLLLGADGNFYGRTSHGGEFDRGTIYRLSPAGELKVLHSFTQAEGLIQGELLQAQDGNFYGTLAFDGAFGGGTAYRMTPEGKFKVIHSFGATESDPKYPGSLMQASDGAFYAHSGGGRHNLGTIFKMHPNGQVRVIHNFRYHGRDGSPYEQPMTEGPDGLLYGTGRGSRGEYKHGFIFRIDKEGRQYEIVYDFSEQSRRLNGRDPGLLALGRDGAFYGITSYGNDDRVGGTIFRFTVDGSLTTLYQFEYHDRVGAPPGGRLLETDDGVFVGTTAGGGELNAGSIYQFTAPAD
jgi:uncharacterized repeat protein (TIGR03803 family)